MQLVKKGSSEGVWFTYLVEGAEPEETPARFKIRRIPTGFDRETHIKVFGQRQQVRRKDGALLSDIEPAKSLAYTLELACYALLDSECAEVPASILGEAAKALGAESSEAMVALDGKLTPDVRRALLSELPTLASWVVAKSNTLTAQAVEEEAAAGKTS